MKTLIALLVVAGLAQAADPVYLGYPEPVVKLATIQALFQSAAMPQRSIGLADEDGLYRVTGYLAISLIGTSGGVAWNVFWTDGLSNKPMTTGTSNVSVLTQNNAGSATFCFYAKKGTEIKVNTNWNGVLGAPQYDAFWVLEKI